MITKGLTGKPVFEEQPRIWHVNLLVVNSLTVENLKWNNIITRSLLCSILDFKALSFSHNSKTDTTQSLDYRMITFTDTQQLQTCLSY